MKFNAKQIAIGGIVAALYVVLTIVSASFNLASGAIQFRISEALCIIPVFCPAAIPGLFVGCLISNLLTGAVIWDIIFGSLATLIGAIGTRLLRKNRYLACIPPILSNVIIVPFVLIHAYGVPDSYPFLALTVGIGEVVCAGVLGQLLYQALYKHQEIFS